jgi:hypothetical protein
MKTYRKTITLVIVLTLFVSLGASFGSATTSGQRYLTEFIPDILKAQLSPDASTYERLSTDALNKLTLFNNRVEQLKKRGQVTPQEAAGVQSDANTLKSLLGNLKNSLNSIIDKLKGANKFSSEFDTIAVNSVRAKKAEAANKLVASGGARALLNTTLSNLNAAITEINNIQADPIFSPRRASLNERDFGQVNGYSLLPVAHSNATAPAAPAVRFAIVVIKCSVLGARLLIKTIKGTDTQDDADAFRNCDE